MTPRAHAALLRAVARVFIATLAAFTPIDAGAQTPAPPAAVTATDATPVDSRLWLVAGGTFATVRGDCQTCEADFPYRHSGGVLGNVGYRVTSRMDAGAELFWMPMDTASGHIRMTHINAVAQFRPWVSKGFFVKGGAGMAFLRNWVDAVGDNPINSKALSVVIGAGWEFWREERVGVQLFGAQHAAAIGDLETTDASVPDVMGNFWSIGAAIVIR